MIYPHLLIPSFDYVNILYGKFCFYCSSLYYSKKTSDAPFKNSNKQNLISLRGKQDVADGNEKRKTRKTCEKKFISVNILKQIHFEKKRKQRKTNSLKETTKWLFLEVQFSTLY